MIISGVHIAAFALLLRLVQMEGCIIVYFMVNEEYTLVDILRTLGRLGVEKQPQQSNRQILFFRDTDYF